MPAHPDKQDFRIQKKSRSPLRFRASWTLVALLLSSRFLSAAPVEVSGIVVGTNSVTVTFQTDGSLNQFTLQRKIGLDAENWNNANNATLTALGNNAYSFALPRTLADKQFYRILGRLITGTPLDPDGDGLASTLEASFTTNPDSPDYSDPNLFDTDGDGFSDGLEFAFGTQPNNPASKPDQGLVPQVQFAESSSSIVEGEDALSNNITNYVIPLTISPSYTGPIYYEINSRSTASSPTDFVAISGVTNASGGTASITLAIKDNLEISTANRIILIDLSKNTRGEIYNPAGRVTHSVILGDNDAYWNGVLSDQLTQRNFRLCVKKNTTISNTELAFVSGNSDGLVSPDGGASSQSTGVIPQTNLAGNPQSIFVALNPVCLPNSFSATTPELPATTGGAFGTTELKRVLTLTALPGAANPGHLITPTLIAGTFTETLSHPTDLSLTYLNVNMSGSFILSKDIPQSTPITSPFIAE